MLKVLHIIYRLIHYSSLDVSVCAALLAWPLAQQYCPNSAWVYILANSVQIIYLSDHIFDVYQNKTRILSERHKFIKDYLKLCILVLTLLFLANASLCLIFLNTSTLLTGLGLCAVVIIYFYNNLSLKIIPKEILTAIIYAIGICLIPVYYNISSNKIFEILFLMLGVSVCTFINLICNNLFEWNEDEANAENSFSQKVGVLFSERILKFLYLISFSGFIGSLFSKDFFIIEYSFSLAVICLVHLLIYKNQTLPFLIKYRRSIMEWSFAIPGLIYIWL